MRDGKVVVPRCASKLSYGAGEEPEDHERFSRRFTFIVIILALRVQRVLRMLTRMNYKVSLEVF